MQFIVTAESPDRKFCLLCEHQNLQDLVEVEVEKKCEKCGHVLGECGRFSHPDQPDTLCYWCYVGQLSKERKDKKTVPVGAGSAAGSEADGKAKEGTGTVRVLVRTLTGKENKFDVGPDDLVYDLYCQINTLDGTPMSMFSLIFGARQLTPHQPLSLFGVENESKITLVLNLRGS